MADATSEVVKMLTDDSDLSVEDLVVGRMSEGLDENEFDVVSRDRILDMPNKSEGAAGDELDLMAGDDPAPTFETPGIENFPVFKAALDQAKAEEPKGRVMRVDTEHTYGDFVCDKAVKEIARRVDELRAVIEQHLADHHGPKTDILRKWDVIGAAEGVAKIADAKTPHEAVDAMHPVEVELPPFADGKVKCWKDGNDIVCSIRFAAADGTVRIATVAAKPQVNEEAVVGAALRQGIHPVSIIGALPELADRATGRRLVRDICGAAMEVQRRLDVCGMDGSEPLLLVRHGAPVSEAPVRALMHLHRRARGGDPQAQKELAVIRTAAATPSGRVVAAPLLAESQRRLAGGGM